MNCYLPSCQGKETGVPLIFGITPLPGSKWNVQEGSLRPEEELWDYIGLSETPPTQTRGPPRDPSLVSTPRSTSLVIVLRVGSSF